MASFTSRIQDLIARNIESVIEAATNPSKMLRNHQREIEEAIIELEGERSRANQCKTRLEAQIVQNELKAADWDDKAKSAMQHGREDLARQALMAKEASGAAMEKARGALAQTHRELADIEKGMEELEAQRLETLERIRAQAEVDTVNTPDQKTGAAAGKADALRGKIAELHKRSQFIAEQISAKQTPSALGDEIEEMRGKRRIDIEIEAMKRARGGSGSGSGSGGSSSNS
jgi:phage shock protein A